MGSSIHDERLSNAVILIVFNCDKIALVVIGNRKTKSLKVNY